MKEQIIKKYEDELDSMDDSKIIDIINAYQNGTLSNLPNRYTYRFVKNYINKRFASFPEILEIVKESNNDLIEQLYFSLLFRSVENSISKYGIKNVTLAKIKNEHAKLLKEFKNFKYDLDEQITRRLTFLKNNS